MVRIRAVLDTNVLASGFLGRNRASPPVRIIDAWRAGRFDLYCSEFICDELRRTLNQRYFQRFVTTEQVGRLLDLLRARSTMVEPLEGVGSVATHPEDDVILAIALAAAADYLVTGDQGLLDVEEHAGVRIVNPRAFDSIVEADDPEAGYVRT